MCRLALLFTCRQGKETHATYAQSLLAGRWAGGGQSKPRFGFRGATGRTFLPLGRPGELCRTLRDALRPRRPAYHPDSDFAAALLRGRAVGAPEAVSRNCPGRFAGAALGTLAGFRMAPLSPGGRRVGLPSPRASAPLPRGSPFAGALQGPAGHSPPGGRALSARRRPRPAPRGDSPGPRPLPPTPGAGAGRGGDGDWAAARGRVLGREARRPLSFSAPAPPPPPPSLLAPAAAAEVGALAGPPRLLPQPGPSPSAAPPPLAAAASLLPPPSRSFPERPAGRERGGCEEA